MASSKLLPRMAGGSLKFLKSLFAGQSPGEIALRLAPDVGFGVLEAAMTPGDITDKLIAGSGSALGGVSGGLLLGKLGGNNAMLTQALDMAGSIGGDFAGRAGAEVLMKAKDKVMGGKGQTPYERMSEEQSKQFAEQIRSQLLAELGLLPGSTQSFLIDQGMS